MFISISEVYGPKNTLLKDKKLVDKIFKCIPSYSMRKCYIVYAYSNESVKRPFNTTRTQSSGTSVL